MEANSKLLVFWVVASSNAQRMLDDTKVFLTHGSSDRVFIYSVMFSITYFCMCNNVDCDYYYSSFLEKMAQQNGAVNFLDIDESDDFMQCFFQCMKSLKRQALYSDDLVGMQYQTAIMQLLEKKYPSLKAKENQRLAACYHVIQCFKQAFSANEQFLKPYIFND